MKIDVRAEKAIDDATAKAETGKTLTEWYETLDEFGGPGKGRREIGNLLYDKYKLSPWWIATLNIEYEAARNLKEGDGRSRGYSICATKSIKTTPDACFAAFAKGSALDTWFGSKNVIDLKEGGRLQNADGNVAMIRKVTPGKAIKFTWLQPDAGADTPVEIKFQAAGAKTTVTVTQDRLQSRAEADGLRRSWGSALDSLKEKLET